MKKIGLFVISLFNIILLIGNFTQAADYEYTNMDITANILIDGTIDIKEDITTKFFIQKHGIIRFIPLNYSVSNQAFHIDISNIKVLGKNFSTTKNNGIIEIKIGNADRTVIGEQYYPISYTTYGLIRNFSGMGYSELYWNLVGYDFDTNINKVRAEIFLPKIYTGFTANDFLITTDGKTKTVKEFQGKLDWSRGDRIIITYNKQLPAYQGITLAIRFPNNYFEFDHDKQAQLIGHIKNNLRESIQNSTLPAIIYILISIALVFIGVKISNKNQDLKYGTLKGYFAKQFHVVVQYEPPKGLNSAEVGLLLHRESKPKDMLSLIYKWAIEGLITLTIEEEGSFLNHISKKVIITKNKDISIEAPEYERDFFKALVRHKRNKILETSNLYSRLHLSALEKYGESKGWLTTSKTNIVIAILFIPLLFVLTSIFVAIFEKTHPLLNITLILFAVVTTIALLSGYNLKETEEGAKLISHILGYKEFLRACDENKLRSFLKQDPLYFDKILPYAVVFGLETELIKKIEPIMTEMNIKSSLYDGDSNYISTITHTLSSAAAHSVRPASSSGHSSNSSYSFDSGFSGGSSFDGGGGGFSSGGGGGGGGGRSW